MSEALALDHVQLTIRAEDEQPTLHFYGSILGLMEIPKPEVLRKRGGAWYQIGPVQLHVSIEEMPEEQNDRSKRHVCFRTTDLDAIERRLLDAGVKIIPDNQPTPEAVRFYVRDPGGNRVEISESR